VTFASEAATTVISQTGGLRKGAQRDLTPQAGKQVAYIQFARARRRSSRHQADGREGPSTKRQAFPLDRRVTSVARLGDAQQALRRFALDSNYKYNTVALDLVQLRTMWWLRAP
jgi:hypothetical protein